MVLLKRCYYVSCFLIDCYLNPDLFFKDCEVNYQNFSLPINKFQWKEGHYTSNVLYAYIYFNRL